MNNKQNIPRIGYSVLRIGQDETAEICLVIPHMESINSVSIDSVTRLIYIKGANSMSSLPDAPADVARALADFPGRVLLVTTDTLSTVRSSVRASAPRDDSKVAATLFNDFMTRAVRSGAVSIEHRRVRSRQPENEAFIRKAVATIQRLAVQTKIDTKVVELTIGQPLSGRIGLANAAAQLLVSHPNSARYLGETNSMPDPFGVRPSINLFTTLQAYAFFEVSGGLSAMPTFGTSAITVAVALSGQSDKIRSSVMNAADSVFSQSFADVHAIALCAAFDGQQAALAILAEVVRRRTAGGDFAAFSLSPLSHDSSAALSILRTELELGRDFSKMSRDAIWGRSMWMAAEGVGAWLSRHGSPPNVASSLVAALETAGYIAVSASGSIDRVPLLPVEGV